MSDELDQIPPEVAKRIYLEQRAEEVSDATLQSHEYRIEAFVDWCDEKGIDSMAEIGGMECHEYRVHRRESDGIKPVTLQGEMSTLCQFFRVCASIDAVEEGLHEKILLPKVPKADQSNDQKLETGRAHETLEYLGRYPYGSRRHVTLLLLWRTSMRRGGIRALDLQDFDRDEPALNVRHRPETDTPLKNGE